MKILRWILMLPASFLAAVIASLIVNAFPKPLGSDSNYAATFCSYFASVAVAASVAPKHRLGTIIIATLAVFVLIVAVIGNSHGVGTPLQRSRNPTARLVLGLLGVAGASAWALRSLKDDSEK